MQFLSLLRCLLTKLVEIFNQWNYIPLGVWILAKNWQQKEVNPTQNPPIRQSVHRRNHTFFGMRTSTQEIDEIENIFDI